MWQEIAVGFIFFFAMVVSAITGFAGNMLAMPGAIQLIGITDAKVVVTLVSTVNGIIVTAMTWRYVNFREIGKIIAFMLPGMLVGYFLYYQVDLKFLLYIYGSVIVAIAVYTWLGKTGPRKVKLPLMIVLMTCAGLMQSLFVSGGAFVVLYAVTVFTDKAEFRATLSALWVVSNLLILGQEIGAGEITSYNFTLSVYVVIPTLFGIYLGNRIYKKVSGSTFFNMANFLLVISGLSCFIK